MAQMDDDTMEIQLLLAGPTNEENLHECMGGIVDHNTHMMGYDLHSLTGEGATSLERITDNEMEDYLEPSMLGSFISPWKCSRRSTRIRSKLWGVEASHLFGVRNTLMTGRKKCGRKNNDHWTEEEMTELVQGVSKQGVGKWSQLKRYYFSTSIRTAMHLKDKWRNLVRACRRNSSKKKVIKLQKATDLIVRRFKRQILDTAKRHVEIN